MKKAGVLSYSISLLGLSAYGLSSHSFYVQAIMSLAKPHVFFRILLVSWLLLYVFVPAIRLRAVRILLGISGPAILILGVVSLFSPTLAGHTNQYILIGDSLALIEGGILAVVLSAELPEQRSRFMAKAFAYEWFMSIYLRLKLSGSANAR